MTPGRLKIFRDKHEFSLFTNANTRGRSKERRIAEPDPPHNHATVVFADTFHCNPKSEHIKVLSKQLSIKRLLKETVNR